MPFSPSPKGNGTARTAYGWYLDLAKAKVEETVLSGGEPVILIGHSAGGWLARALLDREGKAPLEKFWAFPKMGTLLFNVGPSLVGSLL